MNRNSSLEPDFLKSSFYTVEKGDTLRSIAQKIFGDPEQYRKIMELNGLNNYQIFAGQVLRIPENLESNIVIYRVRPRDTLWKISEKFLNHGPRYNEIMYLNGLTSDMIYPGQILKIAVDDKISPRTYVVQPGDTLWKIASKILGDGNKYQEIMKLNNLTTADISVGQRLNLPQM